MKHVILVGGPRFAHRKIKTLGHEMTFIQSPEEFRAGDEKIGVRLFVMDACNKDLLGELLVGLNNYKHIDGIICFKEFEQEAVQHASSLLNLPRTTLKAIDYTRNKDKMRQLLNNNNLSHVNSEVVSEMDDIYKFIDKYGYPVIIKPKDDTGSRNILALFTKEDIAKAADRVKEFKGSFLIEEYLDGPEISVESFTLNGKHEVLTLTDKLTTGYPNYIEVGHTMPSALPNETQLEVKELVKKFLSLIDHTFGPSHIEIKITKNGPKIVEAHVRPGGDCIVDLMELAYGYDLYMIYAKAVLKELDDTEIKETIDGKGAAAIRYFIAQPGKLVSTSGLDEIEKMPGWFRTFNPYVDGMEITPFENSFTRQGWVMVYGKDNEEVNARAEAILKKVKINTTK